MCLTLQEFLNKYNLPIDCHVGRKDSSNFFFHFIALKTCHVDIKDGTKEIQQKAFYYFYHCKFFRCQQHFQPKSLKSLTKNLILDIILCKQTAIIKLVFAPFEDNFCLLCNVVINASQDTSLQVYFLSCSDAALRIVMTCQYQ